MPYNRADLCQEIWGFLSPIPLTSWSVTTQRRCKLSGTSGFWGLWAKQAPGATGAGCWKQRHPEVTW